MEGHATMDTCLQRDKASGSQDTARHNMNNAWLYIPPKRILLHQKRSHQLQPVFFHQHDFPTQKKILDTLRSPTYSYQDLETLSPLSSETFQDLIVQKDTSAHQPCIHTFLASLVETSCQRMLHQQAGSRQCCWASFWTTFYEAAIRRQTFWVTLGVQL